MNSLVSVIVPIYNVEKFLCKCIITILHQSYYDLEIILVDDGSPDSCGKMCDEFAMQDHRVKVIHKQNGGLSDARNAGIDIATGDYITFIDGDDYVMPDMIEYLMASMIEKKVDIVQCSYVRCKDDYADKANSTFISQKQSTVYSDDKMSAYLKEKRIHTVAWGKIYKTSLFHEVRFPVGRLHEDVFTTYRLIHEAGSVAVTDYVGYVYRINENSITTSRYTSRKLDSIYGKLEQSGFIEKNYPDLSKQAYSEIIYACNQCLFQMAKCRYSGEKEDALLQKLYRQYGKYYLCGKTSFWGKIVVILAMANENMAKLVLTLKT